MPREYDDGVPIRSRRRTGFPVAVVVGVAAAALLSLLAVVVVVWLAFMAGKSGGQVVPNLPAVGVEKWTPRDLCEHLNSKGGRFRLMTSSSTTFITEAPPPNDDPYRGEGAVPFIRADVNYVEVKRFETQEEARQFVGSKEERNYWQWRNFAFNAPDANSGASGRVKRLLGE